MPTARKGPSGIRLKIRRTGYSLRSVVSSSSVFLALARLKYPEQGKEPEIFDRRTELVIEGFPRSANTFAVVAFQLAQDTPVRIAHHLHASAQLIAAAKRGVPSVALIREPEEAIISEVLRKPAVTVRHAMSSYLRFYGPLEPYRERLTVGRFDEVVGDFGSVIRRLNARFGTGFAPFEHTEQNIRECFDLIDERTRGSSIVRYIGYLESGLMSAREFRRVTANHDPTGSRHTAKQEARFVARPSGERDRMKEAVRGPFWGRDLARLRDAAFALYQRFAPG
jgi:hypothetical protein